MALDPYSSPRSTSAPPDTKQDLPARPIRGIVFGSIIDLGGTILLTFVGTIIYAFVLTLQGATPNDIQRLIENYDDLSAYSVVITILGIVMSFIGGWCCAKISRTNSYVQPVIMAVLLFIFSILSAWGISLSLTFVFLPSIASVLVTLLGARAYIRSQSKSHDL